MIPSASCGGKRVYPKIFTMFPPVLSVFSKLCDLRTLLVIITFGSNTFSSNVHSLLPKGVQRDLINLKLRSSWFLVS